MEPINLTNDQRLFLQAIFDYFHENGKWPTHKYLDKQFRQTYPDLDIEEVSRSFPEGFTSAFLPYSNFPTEATLTISALCLCQGSQDEQTDFVQAMGFCVGKYWASNEEDVQISNEDLRRELNMPELSIRKVGLLIKVESAIWSSFSGPDDLGGWKCTINRRIRHFRGVSTIEQYLEKRDIPMTITSQPTMPTSQNSIIVSKDELQLHPDIRSKCWDLYTDGNYDEAILNATKALEVAVRTKANLPQSCVGVDVINTAFSLKKPLLCYSKIDAEQEGMMSLLRGIIQVFKNPQSHCFVGVQDKSECLRVLLMCSNLLSVVDSAEYVG